jgi:hypothetical protein
MKSPTCPLGLQSHRKSFWITFQGKSFCATSQFFAVSHLFEVNNRLDTRLGLQGVAGQGKFVNSQTRPFHASGEDETRRQGSDRAAGSHFRAHSLFGRLFAVSRFFTESHLFAPN